MGTEQLTSTLVETHAPPSSPNQIVQPPQSDDSRRWHFLSLASFRFAFVYFTLFNFEDVLFPVSFLSCGLFPTSVVGGGYQFSRLNLLHLR